MSTMSTNDIESPTSEIVSALQPYTTCDVADALLKLNHRHGGFVSGPTMWSPVRQEGGTRIVGPAYTVKYVPLDDPGSKTTGHYIDSIPPGSVVVISAPENVPNAVYGGLMSMRAKASGAVGTVVYGRIRDLQEHRDMGYPVFAQDIGTTAPHESLKVLAINTPITLHSPHGETTVHPGDMIVADLNGVVAFPRHLARGVIDLIRPLVEADEKVADALKRGMTFGEASKRFRVAR